MNKNELKELIGECIKEANDIKSDWGDSREEILGDTLRILEREVEWRLTEVMDRDIVSKLLAPLRKAINDEIILTN